MAEDVKHDYHLVEPSPWPVVGALGVFVMLAGAVLWLNKSYTGFGVLAGIPWIFAIGAALVVYTAAGWWRDIIVESVVARTYRPIVKLSFRYAVVLFIAAELAFFAIWFWAYFHFALFPKDVGLGAWPPQSIATLDPWQVPLMSAVILLCSGTTLRWARQAQERGERRGVILGLALTLALGTGFAALMAYACARLPFPFGFQGAALHPFSDFAHKQLAAGQGNLAAIYGSVFVMLAGFAAIHVVLGTIFLAICLGRTIAGHFTPLNHLGFTAAAWYWRFVIAVWLLFFASTTVFG